MVAGRGVGVVVGVPGRDGVFLGVAVGEGIGAGGRGVGRCETCVGDALSRFSIGGCATPSKPGMGNLNSCPLISLSA